MATTPTKPATPPPAPKPATPPPSPAPAPPPPSPPEHPMAAEGTTPETQMRVNIHGIPPAPDMAPSPTPTEGLSDHTRAEMETGKKALEAFKRKGQAELDAGKRAAARHTGQRVTHESKPSE